MRNSDSMVCFDRTHTFSALKPCFFNILYNSGIVVVSYLLAINTSTSCMDSNKPLPGDMESILMYRAGILKALYKALNLFNFRL